MFFTGNRQTRVGSRTLTSSMVELFVTNLISRSHYLTDKTAQTQMMQESKTCLSTISMTTEDKNAEDSSNSYTGTCFFFSRCEQYNFLLPLLRNCCSLIDPFVYWRFYKVLFESISLSWKYSYKLQGCTKPRNFLFRNKIFSATSYD